MTSSLSDNEISILQAMWELKALGTRAVTLEDLARRAHNVPKTEVSANLKTLERRELVTAMSHSGKDLFALSLLGVAYARQTQDRQLEGASHVPRSGIDPRAKPLDR